MYTPDIKKYAMQNAARIRQLEDKIAKFPEGSIHISRSGNRFFYRRKITGKAAKYICKKDLDLARQLIFKKYYELKIRDLQTREKIFAMLMNKMGDQVFRASKFLLDHDGVQELLEGKIPVKMTPPETWIGRQPSCSAPHQEKRIFKCAAGFKVRSKSEVMIANMLYYLGIPFLYEEPLVIENEIFYPDFTIFNPLTGEIVYWEHFGLMDDANYIYDASYKIRKYAMAGIVPNINMIATFESKENPFDYGQLEHALDYFFAGV